MENLADLKAVEVELREAVEIEPYEDWRREFKRALRFQQRKVVMAERLRGIGIKVS